MMFTGVLLLSVAYATLFSSDEDEAYVRDFYIIIIPT